MSHTQKLIQRPKFLSQYPNIVVLRIHDLGCILQQFNQVSQVTVGYKYWKDLIVKRCVTKINRNGADSSMALPCDM